MNPMFRGHAIKSTTNDIRTENELISSVSDNVNEDYIKMSEEVLWEPENKQFAYSPEESIETFKIRHNVESPKRAKAATASNLLSIKRLEYWKLSFIWLLEKQVRRKLAT